MKIEKCSEKDICSRHKRMRDAEALAAIIAAGVDEESYEADDIRRAVGEHGDWHDSSTPCGE